MKTLTRNGLWMLTALLAMALHASAFADKPNLIFITMDDMSAASMGAYGCEIANITPHMDQLASEGMRFDHAYVAAPSCSPSRNVFMTGRHSSVSGVMGFYDVESGHYQTLPEVLRDNGYYTGVVHKPRDTSLNSDYDTFWDYHKVVPDKIKRDADKFANEVTKFLDNAKAHDGPFFCVINISDPHKPFFGDPDQDNGGSHIAPSHVYKAAEIPVPDFLPSHPEIREEVCNYYNSVKRGDDCVGGVIKALKDAGVYDNSVIMFVSDHGMPLPNAKGSLYREGLRTPWVVRWPGKVEANRVDTDHMISAVDLMPTLLDIVGIDVPSGVQGKSFLPTLLGKAQPERQYVFAQFNENAGGLIFPMRSIQSKQYNYIFNPWSDGKTKFVTASTWTATYKTMNRLSKTDDQAHQRFTHWVHRSVEELYDYEKDPHGLVNVIDDPAYARVAKELRGALEASMRESNDYVLEAFLKREDSDFLKAWMKRMDNNALGRARTLEWKRYKNREGGTGKNTGRFVPPAVGE